MPGTDPKLPQDRPQTMDRYFNRQLEDDEAIQEDMSGNNESLDAVNISTPGTYGVNHQGRP